MLASFPLSVFFGVKTMQFCLISDVHVDFGGWDPDILASVPRDMPIVVAGDIHNDVDHACAWLTELRGRFDHVAWVPGNHDFYNMGFHTTRLYTPGSPPSPRTVQDIYGFYQEFSDRGDIVFLHHKTWVHQGMRFVGSTGWHNFQAGVPYTRSQQVQCYVDNMSDAHYITWAGSDPIREIETSALADAIYIENQVNASVEPVVVVTHHVPHAHLLSSKPHNPLWTQLNGSFANTHLQHISHKKIQAWCFGHTHERQDRVIDGCRYINNARGYPRENSRWQPVIIDVE